MEVITMASDAFKSLENKIDRIAGFVEKAEGQAKNKDPDLTGIKLSTEEVCDILDISKRSLQRYRSEKLLKYHISRQKTYYYESDVQRFIKENLSEISKDRLNK